MGTTSAEHERLVAALKASRCGTWRWDIPSDVVAWDEALSEVYGIAHERAPRTSAEFLALIHPDDRERARAIITDCLKDGTEIDYEFRAVVGGRELWIYDRSTLVRDAAGRPAHMTGACLDVTGRKRIEQERDAALERQKLLLQELNHRVKNHLQMVIAMLHLKGARHADAAVREDFAKAVRRIETISSLHDLLCRDTWVGEVDLGAYLRDICESLRRSTLLDSPVRLACEVVSMRTSLDHAVPLGLIVNELVTNAIKHAFTPSGGTITVRLDADNGLVRLVVADDGTGMPASPSSNGVGRRLVEALAVRVGGTVAMGGPPGTRWEVSFAPSLSNTA